MARSNSSSSTLPEPRGRPSSPKSSSAGDAHEGSATHLIDLLLVAGFLGLTFLLGVFPLRDTDFWWHLRTGDLIRQTGKLPVEDWYTFGAAGHQWVDLHWFFEVLLSWGYQHSGVVGLNLAKCVITTIALLILFSARRRDWPVWLMVLTWLPALFLLGGRMYVRPETLTLLYLSIFLAVLERWEEYPRLAFVLPVVQVFWVNSQGLFVLGPVVLVMALIDAALARVAWEKSRRSWWRTAFLAVGLTGLACVLNPYGLLGAFFPAQIANTMSSEIFSRTIAELMPIGTFIEQMGFQSLPLQIHMVTMVLGALSFLLPIFWLGYTRIGSPMPEPEPKSRRGKRSRKQATPDRPHQPEAWRVHPFRLLLYVAFTLLSVQATRNSHQFAAVVGAVTAWNFGEWGAAVRRHRLARGKVMTAPRLWLPRMASGVALIASIVGVSTGTVYGWAREGRTVGLGEEPLWFPHEAARFAGSPGMPDRFVCFHNGHAALYEYYNGPERKVLADARLEVLGPEVYGEYLDLEKRIRQNTGGWRETIVAMGNPGILVDNVHAKTGFGEISATLFTDGAWRCVWFDPIATVFLPESAPSQFPAVDFAARHFRPDPAHDPQGPAALQASARAIYDISSRIVYRAREGIARPMLLLGQQYARRRRDAEPASVEGWKLIGLLEALREPLGSPEDPVPRYRKPFDPVFDLSAARATYALEQARLRDPQDPMVLLSLAMAYQCRGMDEEALPIYETLTVIRPPFDVRVMRQMRANAAIEVARLRAKLGKPPTTTWKNLNELDRAVKTLLEDGRARAAAELLESAYPEKSRPWAVSDLLATLRLHLGEPDAARAVWKAAINPPRPALVKARIAAADLVQDRLDEARRAYREALALDPQLFEAHYGLAVLERDAGHAREAVASARAAAGHALTEQGREAARRIAELAAPYADAPESRKASAGRAPASSKSETVRRSARVAS